MQYNRGPEELRLWTLGARVHLQSTDRHCPLYPQKSKLKGFGGVKIQNVKQKLEKKTQHLLPQNSKYRLTVLTFNFVFMLVKNE